MNGVWEWELGLLAFVFFIYYVAEIGHRDGEGGARVKKTNPPFHYTIPFHSRTTDKYTLL